MEEIKAEEKSSRFTRSRWVWVALAVLTVVFCLVVVPVLLGLVRTFKMNGSSMAPTIQSNDVVTFERFTFWSREPGRGDIVTYKSDGADGMPTNRLFVKRVFGLPGEHIVISNDTLFANGAPVAITNSQGLIRIHSLPAGALVTNLVLLKNQYFVIGDNSSNSLDSRVHGPVSRSNIVGLFMP